MAEEQLATIVQRVHLHNMFAPYELNLLMIGEVSLSIEWSKNHSAVALSVTFANWKKSNT